MSNAYISSNGDYSMSVSHKPLSKVDGAMWHTTINFVKEHSIASRFLVIPITLETFTTELLNFPLTSLYCTWHAFAVVLGYAKPDPHLGEILTSVWMAGSVAFFAIATIFSPIYALIKASIIFKKFIQDPLETSQKEAFKSDKRNYKWNISTKLKQVTFTLPNNSKRKYSLPETPAGPIIKLDTPQLR